MDLFCSAISTTPLLCALYELAWICISPVANNQHPPWLERHWLAAMNFQLRCLFTLAVEHTIGVSQWENYTYHSGVSIEEARKALDGRLASTRGGPGAILHMFYTHKLVLLHNHLLWIHTIFYTCYVLRHLSYIQTLVLYTNTILKYKHFFYIRTRILYTDTSRIYEYRHNYQIQICFTWLTDLTYLTYWTYLEYWLMSCKYTQCWKSSLPT